MLRNHKPSGKHTYDITQDVTTDGACSQVHGWRSRPSTTDRSGKGAGPTYQQCFQRADSVQQLRVHICAAQVFRSTIQILHRLPQLVDRLLVLQKHLVRQLLLSDGNANSEEAHAQSTPVGACYSQGDTPTVPCAPHLQHALLLAHATSPPQFNQTRHTRCTTFALMSLTSSNGLYLPAVPNRFRYPVAAFRHRPCTSRCGVAVLWHRQR